MRPSDTTLLQFSAKSSLMPKTLTAYIARKKLERELFGARQRLSHLVELYDSGLWNRLYQDEAFVKAVRRARIAVDHLTDVLHRYGGS